jgi:hypothetical protein
MQPTLRHSRNSANAKIKHGTRLKQIGEGSHTQFIGHVDMANFQMVSCGSVPLRIVIAPEVTHRDYTTALFG